MANEGNLIPAKKGEVRNPKGKPKGTVHWSTIVQNVLADEELFTAILEEDSQIPAYYGKLNKRNGLNAIAAAMLTRAAKGDHRAADWLRKTGYGDKIDLTSDGEQLPVMLVKFVGGTNEQHKDDDNVQQ